MCIRDSIWGGTPRLGSIDPEQEPYKTKLAEAHLKVIDLTKVKGDRLGHGKFAESPEVVQMIGRRLADGQTLGDGKAGLGDKLTGLTMSAAGVVGSAAGMVVSAPLAIVDRRTRESMGDQLSLIHI